ncbi:Trp biosynthesis-associated membrane protein [Actinoplanes derwentensis]|uniref:Trp region conserved hypothetical membrane protein n=1 Tax=Actinoplanes derwentensis TaxID=113562 RepID=A0A1H2BXS7_9ACTN|nr:Trp biosynthesis-associated membrane protein [Actinoplanes derwentensis]GID90175.1 hypothetical protein Ade03nite_90990 [Actinoplanes derwentensis]SDT63058.1 trp region conserved hypothetical membrane protein [Actinoplanes derwentensis]
MRRGPLAAVLFCLAGAGAALFAVTRIWVVEVETRPGLTDLRTVRTGAEVQPWLIGLALTALAGAGALLATRGLARRVLGGFLSLLGTGIGVGAVLAWVTAGPDPVWPVVTVLGGVVVAVGGVLAARHGHRWAAMSSRYERRPPAEPVAEAPVQPQSVPDSRAFWDALDRGEDPTR